MTTGLTTSGFSDSIGDLRVLDGILFQGQGEYVVYLLGVDGVREKPREDLYSACHQIFNDNMPIALVSKGLFTECTSRYERIRDQIKKLDGSLEVFFVPKTLYELVIINKLIREDLKNKALCPNHIFYGGKLRKSWLETHITPERKCLHAPSLYCDKDGCSSRQKTIAYRINNVFIKKRSESNFGFTFLELHRLLESEIIFLRKFSKCGERRSEGEWKKTYHIFLQMINESFTLGSCFSSSPTISFGPSDSYESVRLDDMSSELIRKALQLDCSEIAHNSFILYRGGNFLKDLSLLKDGVPYSSSFGTSLFAGAVHDSGATAFQYICKKKEGEELHAYAIYIPFNELGSSGFYIPLADTLNQLFGKGEFFHARTQVWKDVDTSIT